MGLISIFVDCFKLFMLTAKKPAQRFCILLRCDMLGGVGWGGCNIVLCLRYHRFSSVNTLHVTLHTSVVYRWTHFMLHCGVLLYFGETQFMLCCTLLLCFGEHTSGYVAHCCCTSVNTLHVTLHAFVVLRWSDFMLCCTLLLYFGDQRLCAVSGEAAQRCLPILV